LRSFFILEARVHRIYLAFPLLCCALSAADRIGLPANTTEGDVTLPLRPAPAKGATVNLQPLVDAKGVPLSPQPAIGDPVLADDKLTLHFSDLYFWGPAKLGIEAPPGKPYAYWLQRGPALPPCDVHVRRRTQTQMWLYNFDTHPLALRWRIVSGTESVCGVETDGQPRLDCASLDKWSATTLGPARSDAIVFTLPDSWFHFASANRDDPRKAQLELQFGDDAKAPLLRAPLTLHLDVSRWDALALLLPAMLLDLLWVTFFVTLGAVLLMLAQVMIPNFRKCLRMESQIEGLQERLRAIGSRVSDRLYTRCHQELESVRSGLAMGQAAARFRFLSRLALAGNTAEVNRLAGILPRIESRIGLTEKLDESQSAAVDSDTAGMPPSLCWTRAKQLRVVQGILARQFVTDSDEKSASSSLDLLADPAASLKDFAAGLETRIAGIRREFAVEPWKTKHVDLIAGLNGCAELLPSDAPDVPEAGWSSDELIVRDLAAVRLAIVYQMIALESLLAANPAVKATVLKKLQSSDPAKLEDARLDLLKLSQGFSEADVKTALEKGMWDSYFEPIAVTDQDVLRGSLTLRNKDLNRCAAKNSFQCFWRVSVTPPAGAPPIDDSYERGWDTQIIPPRGAIKLTPVITDADGNGVTLQPTADPEKGVTNYQVCAPRSNTLNSRLLRGLIDASITALVPVITVALTQVQNGGNLTVDKLVLLGFTSQAIRAAIVPESVSGPAEPQPAKTTAADS
jgi:hypothetical protein